MARLILDSGAVIALAAGNHRARAFLERAVRQGSLVAIPAVVIAETTRGGARDAPVNRVINAVDETPPATVATARQAGRLLAASGLADATVDALIVAEAVLNADTIVLTSDFGDLSALAEGHPRVQIERV